MLAVPLALTSITLPHGAGEVLLTVSLLPKYKECALLDIFWRMLDEDFNHEDWKVRFAAVERTTLMFRLVS